MLEVGLKHDLDEICAVTEAEAAAIEAGDINKYLPVLSDDAVFLPPNVCPKSGQELRQWLREFLESVSIQMLEFAHGETTIRDDFACHEYSCSWIATRKSGGDPVTLSFKGMHVLRRQPDGCWKINRNIWNTSPIASSS